MIKSLAVFMAMFLLQIGNVFADDCATFSQSKVFPTDNIVALRMVKQKAEYCSTYYAGVIATIKTQKEILLDEIAREPKNTAMRRLFSKTDNELMLALLTKADLHRLQEKMRKQIDELEEPTIPKIRTEM